MIGLLSLKVLSFVYGSKRDHEVINRPDEPEHECSLSAQINTSSFKFRSRVIKIFTNSQSALEVEIVK